MHGMNPLFFEGNSGSSQVREGRARGQVRGGVGAGEGAGQERRAAGKGREEEEQGGGSRGGCRGGAIPLPFQVPLQFLSAPPHPPPSLSLPPTLSLSHLPPPPPLFPRSGSAQSASGAWIHLLCRGLSSRRSAHSWLLCWPPALRTHRCLGGGEAVGGGSKGRQCCLGEGAWAHSWPRCWRCLWPLTPTWGGGGGLGRDGKGGPALCYRPSPSYLPLPSSGPLLPFTARPPCRGHRAAVGRRFLPPPCHSPALLCSLTAV